MSDFRAIGGVSATLQTLLLDRMEYPDGLASVPVTVGPPPYSSKDTDPRKEDPRVNLFLYRITENGSLKNQEIPGRGNGSGYGHPPLSLNLHYLVTAYGNTPVPAGGAASLFDDTPAHFLLGSAMRVLHDIAIVTDELFSVRPPSGLLVLHESLRDEYERVRLSLEPLSLEDVTKVWTALALRYRLSAAYMVNVVQIESRRAKTFPQPVGKPASPTLPPLPSDPPSAGPWIYVFPIQTPTISELRVRRATQPDEQPFPYARIGDTLVLRGTSLSGPRTLLVFGDVRVPATFASPLRVEAQIPDATVLGAGAIPPDQLLQPGVRTVKVVTSDPLVPQSAATSNEAAFMLVPTVDPATLAYGAGPPRKLTINGARLVGPGPGGETIIGRSSVARNDYLAEDPLTLDVPVPPTLPTRGVKVVVGATLADPVAIGTTAHTLQISIGGTVATISRALATSIPLTEVAGIVAAMIHDAKPTDSRFNAARVELHQNRLFVVPGDLTSAVSITSPPGLPFAANLGLTAAQPAGAGSAYVSGALASVRPLSAPLPRLRMKVGGLAAVTIAVPATSSLGALAGELQIAINAASGLPAYANAIVGTSDDQLLFIAGAPGAVRFDGVPGDDRTVVELQLHANFAVRVRVNGAESIDPAVVELPK
jgi:hypothetical protein